MEGKQMGMNDILPPELIHRIFLRVPAKDLFHLRFVSKLWHSLISDRDFVESHYNLYSAASSHSYFFLVKDTTKSACFVEFDTLFDVAAAPTTLRALPKSMGTWKQQFYGLFLHGAIHWLCYSSKDYIDDGILIFDLKEKSFSKISMPKQLVGCSPIDLTILGGRLAMYSYHNHITEIWVMKEYKVRSS
ncbi:hypothetical protein S83_012739 [Arachis hypogaea]|nr:Putative F-box only protein [Arachis hypogaea]